jgi:hypothetical protein
MDMPQELPMTEVLRAVAAFELYDLTAGGEVEGRPEFDWVDPRTLLVDETYQRRLGKQSVKLIRRIIGGWDWRKFKPPVVARTAEGLKVIDGQHTAIAAASHPGIDLIPIMLIQAESQAEQAAAFVGQNRDRLALSPVQVHKAALAAADPDAVAIERICSEAGVRILQAPPGRPFEAGETLAAASLREVYRLRGAEAFAEMMRVLGPAGLAPLRANHLKAIELLLTEADYRDTLEPDDLSDTLVRMGPKLEREAGVLAATHRLPLWRAIAITLYRSTRHVRRRVA